MIHELANVQTEKIGDNTNIWQFVVVLKDAVIGSNCNVFIENDVTIGDNVTVKSVVQLWDGILIEDNVFIVPNVTFTNDKYPKSKKYPETFQRIIIRNGASIGANCSILGGIEIGADALVGAGSVVTKSIPEKQLWYGNPARFIRNI